MGEKERKRGFEKVGFRERGSARVMARAMGDEGEIG